jgi:hypothetical protein
MELKKIVLGVKNTENSFQIPKTEFEAQNQYGRSGILHEARNNIILRVQNLESARSLGA